MPNNDQISNYMKHSYEYTYLSDTDNLREFKNDN